MEDLSESTIRAVARKLKKYIDVERREDGFDKSGPSEPLGEFSSSKGGSIYYHNTQDRHFQHYFQRPVNRKHYTRATLGTPLELKHKTRRAARHYSLGNQNYSSHSIKSKSLSSVNNNETDRLIQTTAKLLVAGGVQSSSDRKSKKCGASSSYTPDFSTRSRNTSRSSSMISFSRRDTSRSQSRETLETVSSSLRSSVTPVRVSGGIPQTAGLPLRIEDTDRVPSKLEVTDLEEPVVNDPPTSSQPKPQPSPHQKDHYHSHSLPILPQHVCMQPHCTGAPVQFTAVPPVGIHPTHPGHAFVPVASVPLPPGVQQDIRLSGDAVYSVPCSQNWTTVVPSMFQASPMSFPQLQTTMQSPKLSTRIGPSNLLHSVHVAKGESSATDTSTRPVVLSSVGVSTVSSRDASTQTLVHVGVQTDDSALMELRMREKRKRSKLKMESTPVLDHVKLSSFHSASEDKSNLHALESQASESSSKLSIDSEQSVVEEMNNVEETESHHDLVSNDKHSDGDRVSSETADSSDESDTVNSTTGENKEPEKEFVAEDKEHKTEQDIIVEDEESGTEDNEPEKEVEDRAPGKDFENKESGEVEDVHIHVAEDKKPGKEDENEEPEVIAEDKEEEAAKEEDNISVGHATADTEREVSGSRDEELNEVHTQEQEQEKESDNGSNTTVAEERSDVTPSPDNTEEARNDTAPVITVSSPPATPSHLQLHEVVLEGNKDKLKQLLAADPSLVRQTNNHGWSLLHTACAAGKNDIVQALCLYGTDLNAETPTGYTAMHCAALHGHVHCLKMLSGMSCSVNCVTVDKQTPLHLAAMSGHVECCKWLVANRALVMAEDTNGRTPIDLARDYTRSDVEQFLQRYIGQPGSSASLLSSHSQKSLTTGEIESDDPRTQDEWTSDVEQDDVPSDAEKQKIKKAQEESEEKQKMYTELQEKLKRTESSFLDAAREDVEKELEDSDSD